MARNQRKISDSIREFFFPQTRCAVCGAAPCRNGLCEECLEHIASTRHCERCGSFLKPAALYCETCSLLGRIYFERAASCFPYADELRRNILKCKFGGREYLHRPFALLASELVRREYAGIDFDMALPVPVPPQRLKERGYNQVQLFAEEAAEMLGIAFEEDALLTLKESESLVGMTRRQRAEAVKDSFGAVPEKVQGKTVLLFDDIITTGSTANACAKALKKAGAEKVFVAALAGHFTQN